MGQAPVAYLVWSRLLRFNPADPRWPNRDRFVLSCGHASALLYGLLHLAGYEDMTVEELENFRQLHSRTPGHPEYGHAAGVETTTGPLGQGIGNAVGMAIAERLLAERFNRDGYPLFDHRCWVLASDGDLMEGVAAEASSLAGHLALGKLNVIYDANQITIEGDAELSMSEDVAKRYDAYGWHVLHVEDGNDLDEMEQALIAARDEVERPSLIVLRTHIGFGSPNKQDSASSHGSPLGPEEVTLTKQNLGWPLEPTLRIPAEAREPFREAAQRGAEQEAAWDAMRSEWSQRHPELAAELAARESGELPSDWEESLPVYSPEDGKIATRKASGKALNAIQERLPELVGGSADLAGSNNTWLDGESVMSAETTGRNFHFGVREHGMGAALNGMALSGLIRPYGGTFLIFSDYLRPSLRLSALMGLPVIWIFTHDSIFLGEDGPTHQPIAQLAALRAIPNLTVVRPADANETSAAWRLAIENREGPTALILTRQGLPVLEGTAEMARSGVERGAYVLEDCQGKAELILIATGSEVALAVDTREELAAEGVTARVVSMPSWERFQQQDAEYRNHVLPPGCRVRLAIEAASTFGWERWVGLDGGIVGIDRFGASAPAPALAEEYGFTPVKVAQRARELLAR